MSRSLTLRHARAPFLGVAALALAAAAGHAQTLTFDNTCGTGRWHGSCQDGSGTTCISYNNWSVANQLCDNGVVPHEPGINDDVFLSVYVLLDYAEPFRSLSTTTLFRNDHIVDISTTANYGGPVVGRGGFAGTGTHNFGQLVTGDAGSQSMSFVYPATININGGLELPDGAGLMMNTDVYNNSFINWRGDGLIAIDGAGSPQTHAKIHNQPGALFLATGNGEIRGIISRGYVDNAGTFRKDGGLGATTIGSEFANLPSGLIDVRTGTLALTSDGFYLAGTAQIAAGAQLELRGAAHVNGQFTTDGNGFLRVNGNIHVLAGVTATVRNLSMSLIDGFTGHSIGPGRVDVTTSASIGGIFGGGGTLNLLPTCTSSIASDIDFTDSGTRIDNRGTCTWDGGQIRITEGASLNNLAGADLDCRVASNIGGYFFTTGTASNAGTLRKTAGGRIIFDLPFVNTGTVMAQSGRLAFSRFRQTSGESVLAGGELDSDFQVEPLRFEGGTLRGVGNIRGPVLNTGAVVAPGNSPGAISISAGLYGNSYTQGPAGTLRMEIGGTTPTTFDRLAVDGPAVLDGTLQVTLINGFVPQVGQTFNIITSTSRSGQFSNITLPPGLQLVYTPTTVALMLAGPAGCNRADVGSLGGNPAPDGVLTVDDVVAFLSAFFANNITVADIAGLGGGSIPDGQVTVDDLVTFLTEFFTVCP
ncbi:MAG: GC-type dockerin domain-anchored protein [Phycisphaerales bacterium]